MRVAGSGLRGTCACITNVPEVVQSMLGCNPWAITSCSSPKLTDRCGSTRRISATLLGFVADVIARLLAGGAPNVRHANRALDRNAENPATAASAQELFR